MRGQGVEHQRERERAVYEEVAVTFDVPSVCRIEVQQVRVERQRRVSEEEGARGRQGVREVGILQRCSVSVP